MKRTLHTPIGLLLAVILTFGLQSWKGSQQKEERKIEAFDELSLSIPATIYFTQQAKTSMVIEASATDLAEIKTISEGDELEIKAKNKSHRFSDVTIYLSSPNIETFNLGGSGDIIAKEAVETNELEINIGGSGNVQMENLTAKEVEVSVAGSGDVLLKGTGHELDISIAGSGDVNAIDFVAREADISIAGSGDVKVYAEEKLETSIVGSGDIYYKGKPIVDATSLGSGSTKSIN